MQRHPAAVLLLLLLAASCSGASRAGTRIDRSSIELPEIREANYPDAFALVQALRPNWLITRGQGSITQREEIKVYLDGLLMGGVEYLKQISTQSISFIRWYDGLEATQRWGLDHGLGAIAVSTRRQGG
jgi:hypothetical protein